ERRSGAGRTSAASRDAPDAFRRPGHLSLPPGPAVYTTGKVVYRNAARRALTGAPREGGLGISSPRRSDGPSPRGRRPRPRPARPRADAPAPRARGSAGG